MDIFDLSIKVQGAIVHITKKREKQRKIKEKRAKKHKKAKKIQ